MLLLSLSSTARRGLLALSLLAGLPQCSGPSSAPPDAVGVEAAAPEEAQAPEPPLGQLVAALLDTTAAGSVRAADDERGLLAGESVRAFYAFEPSPIWTLTRDRLTPEAATALAVLTDATAYGLQPENYGLARLEAIRDSIARGGRAGGANARRARFEVYLTDAVLRLMRDLHYGRLRTYAPPGALKQAAPPLDFAHALRSGIASTTVKSTILACQPPNREYQRLQTALAEWLQVPVAADSLEQWRGRYQQIAVNLERWRWEVITDSTYVLINVPSFELQLVRGTRIVQEHRVIVGHPNTPTPTLSSALTYFTTAPDWRVPHSIATKDILPKVQRDTSYLTRNKFRLYDRKGRPVDATRIRWDELTPQHFPYFVRQSAGCDNALGNIVFRFRNPYSVYVHDTPARQLFAKADRGLSHGCIRLEKPFALAAYLLRRDGSTARLPSEDACANQPQAQDFLLRKAMPLHVRYFTCVADPAGKIQFHADLYQLDDGLRQALFPAAT